MKIVSMVVLMVALIGSWRVAYSMRPVSESMHLGIQQDLKVIITEYIQKRLPTAKNIKFDKFWTETVRKNKVKAFFVYSFEDNNTESGGSVRTQIEGFATLNKAQETEEEITWNFDELQIKDNQVEFIDPIQIKAGVNEGTEEPAKNSETPAAADPHSH